MLVHRAIARPARAPPSSRPATARRVAHASCRAGSAPRTRGDASARWPWMSALGSTWLRRSPNNLRADHGGACGTASRHAQRTTLQILRGVHELSGSPPVSWSSPAAPAARACAPFSAASSFGYALLGGADGVFSRARARRRCGVFASSTCASPPPSSTRRPSRCSTARWSGPRRSPASAGQPTLAGDAQLARLLQGRAPLPRRGDAVTRVQKALLEPAVLAAALGAPTGRSATRAARRCVSSSAGSGSVAGGERRRR